MKARNVSGLEPEGTLADNAERIVRVRLDELTVYAVGGSATSLRQLCGDELTPRTLEAALSVVAAHPVRDAASGLSLARERVRLLPAGLVLLRAAAEAFGGVPLDIARGGLREGVLLEDFAGAAGRS